MEREPDRSFGVYIHVPFCVSRCGYCDFVTYTASELNPRGVRGAGATDAIGGANRAGRADASGRVSEAGATGEADGTGRTRETDEVSVAGAGSRVSAATGTSRVGSASRRAPGHPREEFVRCTTAEVALARRVLDEAGWEPRPAATVFFGGGTPTLLAPDQLVAILDAVRKTFGLEPGAEVTVEANPDSVDGRAIARLAAGGVTRLSLGMQSALPEVLRTLGRTHDRSHVPRAVDAAHSCGMDVSVDLIYGTPGETLGDWEASVRAALGYGIGHLSVYALTLEPHTPLARRIARGEIAGVDVDDQAEKYELADTLAHQAGLEWYEISNFARTARERSRHNLGYWRGADWWGIGPGAHSALGGAAPVRWWNVAHPRAYAQRLATGLSPEAGRETPDAEAQVIERVMLGIRLTEGLSVADIPAAGRDAIVGLIADGLVDEVPGAGSGTGSGSGLGAERGAVPGTTLGAAPTAAGRVRLTLRGRLLADVVTRALIG